MSHDRAGRLTDTLLLVFAFALPLSIAVSEIALCSAIVAWLASAPWHRSMPRGMRALGLATLALLGTWIVASALAVDPLASFANLRKLYSISLVFMLVDRVRAARAAQRIAVAALAGGLLSAAFGVAAFAALRLGGSGPGYRLEGVFSTAMTTGNVFATLAIAALGEAFLVAGTGVGAGAALAAFGVLAVALVGTLTRSSWLAFLAGSSLILGARRPRVLFAGLLVAVVGLVLGPSELSDRVVSIVDPTHVTNAGRISLWKSGLEVVRDHPISGVGLADHLALIERYRRPDATFVAGHFHNNVVQIAASTGLIGLAAYLAWMLTAAALLVAAVRGGDRGRALVGLAVWIGFQVAGMFDWSFGDIEVVNQFYLWLGLGLAAASCRGAAATPRSS